MMDDDDDDESYGDDTEERLGLGHWIEENYVGSPQFTLVELIQPGQLEGEDFRVRLVVDDRAHFFVSVMSDAGVARVGLNVDDQDRSESIERTIEESGGSMTEFLEQAMASDEELEYEMQHFHDDAFYFCSEIPYDGDEQLDTASFHEMVATYLDGYIAALGDLLAAEED